MEIKKGYIDERGTIYNVRNINYGNLESARCSFGTFINESRNNKLGYSDDEYHGIYLYKSNYDENKALRIYKDFMHYKYVGYTDERIVSELQKRQKFVHLTEFPTGIVTIENSVIGQEIPYYEQYETIRYMFENNKVLAALYFIACVACVIAFFSGGHKWGYLVAAVVWLMLGIYLLVRKDDDIG